MRQLVLAFLVLAACAKHTGSQKLEGHWRGQKADGVPDTAQVPANTFAAATEIFAQGNQIAIQTPAGRPPAATYTIDKEDANTLVIHTDRDGTETFSFNAQGNVMVWKIDAQRSITFVKVP
jgi:hypothetical protein